MALPWQLEYPQDTLTIARPGRTPSVGASRSGGSVTTWRMDAVHLCPSGPLAPRKTIARVPGCARAEGPCSRDGLVLGQTREPCPCQHGVPPHHRGDCRDLCPTAHCMTTIASPHWICCHYAVSGPDMRPAYTNVVTRPHRASTAINSHLSVRVERLPCGSFRHKTARTLGCFVTWPRPPLGCDSPLFTYHTRWPFTGVEPPLDHKKVSVTLSLIPFTPSPCGT